MDFNENRKIFSSKIFFNTDGYELEREDNNDEYNHSMKRLFVEVVIKYKLPFISRKREFYVFRTKKRYRARQ
jgi:hypothetical protein